MRRLLDVLEKLILSAAAALLLLVTVVLVLQVYYRYVMNVSTPWASEIARYGTVWLTLISLGVVARRREEIRVDFLEHFMRNRTLTAGLAVSFKVLEILFMIVVAVSAVRLLPIARTQTLVGLGVSMTIVIWSFVVGPVVVIPFLLEGLLDTVKTVFRGQAKGLKGSGRD